MRGLRPGALLDPDFWRRFNWQLAELEDEAQLAYAKLQLLRITSSFVLPFASLEGLEQTMENARKCVETGYQLLFPWEASQNEEVAATLQDLWAEDYGDPNDPAVQRQVDEDAARMEEWIRRTAAA